MTTVKIIESVKLFGIKDGLAFWTGWEITDPIKYWAIMNLTRRPFCTWAGWHCNNKNCEHEHITEREQIRTMWKIGVCNGMLNLPNGGFCMCEEIKGHFGNCHGLMYEWYQPDKDVPVDADALDYSRGVNLFKMHIERVLGDNNVKQV